jgi:hypothetical protein
MKGRPIGSIKAKPPDPDYTAIQRQLKADYQRRQAERDRNPKPERQRPSLKRAST